MRRKPQCKTVITQSMYFQIRSLYELYTKVKRKGANPRIDGVECQDIYDLYRVINAKFHMHKSERTLRRIYRGEYLATEFPV